MKQPLYLLDGYSLVYRSYFAFIRNPLRNPKGENVSAIFGFFRSLMRIFDERKPDYFAVIMDSQTPTFRHEKYEPYKATREKTPDDLKEQIPHIEQILDSMNIPTVRVNGFEADDVMATFAERCSDDGRTCYIISGDKDLLQMVDGPVTILRPEGGSFKQMDRDQVFADWSIYPEQILDYLSLVGDSSDNVPGVKGIGAKTAAKLLGEYGTLDGIYEHLDEISSKSQRQKLADGKDSAYMSRDLIVLRRDAPIEVDVHQLSLDELDRKAAIPFLLEHGMKSLAEELGAENADEKMAELHENETGEKQERGTYTQVTSLDQLDEWVDRAKQAGIYAFDSETTSVDPHRASPVGFSLSVSEGEGCYIPLMGPSGEVLPAAEVRPRIASLLEDSSLKLVGQNIKYDYQVLKRWGVTMAGIYFDTMIAAWVLDTTANTYNMDALAERHLGYKTIHYDEVVAKTPRGEAEATFDSADLASATDYAAEDTDITLRLFHLFEPQIGDRGFSDLFYRLEMPLIRLLADMELTGISVNTDVLDAYSVELSESLVGAEQRIYSLCKREFNIASTKQLQQVLFEERKLTPTKKTKTGYSTDTSVLQELAREDPVPALVLEHRLLSKLKSTYVDALPKLVNPETGRIHTSFNQTGTATGRLSSTDPNLQNIPIRDEEGRKIREAFVPRTGWVFVSADYAQIELVILAHLSGDPALTQAFRDGEDVHRRTGALIFGVDAQEVTAEQRRIAKTINFGVMYGMSAFRLARELGIPRKDAADFIDRYFTQYAKIRDFIDRTVEQAEKAGVVKTIMGRERSVPDIGNRNRNVRMGAQRIAVNTPIQGSAADIVKTAMLRVDRRIRSESLQARILLQVHDELILECPEGEADHVEEILIEEMTDAIALDVPLTVSVERGTSWGELH
jgi:DNA polymerase-1